MRLWHVDMLPYLPDMQLKGQLRELVAIMHDWRDKGQTNHLLINYVMTYPKTHLYAYFNRYAREYEKRFGKPVSNKYQKEFYDFMLTEEDKTPVMIDEIFPNHHTEDYLNICMYNLYEKYLGIGKSKLSEADWDRLINGYCLISKERNFICEENYKSNMRRGLW